MKGYSSKGGCPFSNAQAGAESHTLHMSGSPEVVVHVQVVDALEKRLPADGGPPLKQKADIRMSQTVTRVELVDRGVAVHIAGQVRLHMLHHVQVCGLPIRGTAV